MIGRRGGKQQDRELFKEIRVILLAVISWFALSTAGELIGNQANETAFGQTLGHYVLLAAVIVVPAFGVLWLLLGLRDRRRARSAIAEDDRPPPPPQQTPPRWHARKPLCDRVNEVAAAVETVRRHGIVAVVGPRDIGSSAVGQAAVQELVDDHGGDPYTTFRFDLRSRSTSGPDDAAAVAGQVVSAFGIAPPADDTAEVLARVARTLVASFRDGSRTLMLDNVTTSEQVRWLVREWPTDGPPWLVIGGEVAVAEAFDDRGDLPTVEVGPMEIESLRAIWNDELKPAEPKAMRWRDRLGRGLGELRRRLPWGESGDDLDKLLAVCLGRPKAVKALVAEVRRPGNVTVETLLAALDSTGQAEGPIERVWTAILASITDGLSERAVWLLHALAVLPVTGLSRGSVAAMVGEDDATALDELWIRNLVEQVDGRYRLPSEVRRVIIGTRDARDRQADAALALPVLLHHYAAHVEPWAVRLDDDAGNARAWFQSSEASLRPLFSTEHYADRDLLKRVVEDLSTIADALEKWYVREQQASGLLKVNREMHALMERADRADLAVLAAIRMATGFRLARRFGDATTWLDLAKAGVAKVPAGRVQSELDTRLQVERALLAVVGAGPVDLSDPPDDEPWPVLDELERALPNGRASRRQGTPVVLVNLGALCISRGRAKDALAHLHLAERMATDVGCAAHSIELQGVALALLDDRLVDAARRWQRAREMFVGIGEEQGEARCLQHLGAAALVDTRVAGQLRDGEPEALSPQEAAVVALPRLTRAKQLRAGQPDTPLTDHYLAMATNLLT